MRPGAPVVSRASPARGSAAGARKGASPRCAAAAAGGEGSSSRLGWFGSRADFSAARAHLRYLQRDGVTREGQPGELYDAASDEADGKAFLERSAGDRHQFRFIVSAEDGARTVSVEVISVVRASDRTFTIRWVETAYENGLQIAAEGFSGVIEIVFEPPRTTEALLANPSGNLQGTSIYSDFECRGERRSCKVRFF